MLEDGRVLDVANVIWCTGFRHDLSWIDLPIFGEDGELLHERGVVTSEPGLYFVGLFFQYSAASTSSRAFRGTRSTSWSGWSNGTAAERPRRPWPPRVTWMEGKRE